MSGRIGLFRFENIGYAIPLERLLRVVDSGVCSALPLVPVGIAGMLIQDNEIIPLLKSSWLMDNLVGDELSSAYKVIIATEYGPIAFPADATVGIVAEDRCSRVDFEEESARFFSEGVSYRDNRYQVLDTELLMNSLIRPN